MKKIYFLLISAFLLFASGLHAQVNYTFTAVSGTYNAVVAGTSPTLISPDPVGYTTTDEGYANSVPIGFSFMYNGTPYTTFNVNANGFMTFGSGFNADPLENSWSNNLSTGPTTQINVRPIVAPLWDDMDMVADTDIKYELTGSAGSRVLTVQWSNIYWRFTAATTSIDFQVKLFENTNVIEFHYNQLAGATATPTASIGLTAVGTGSGNFLSLQNTGTAPTTSTSTETTTLATRPASGQIYRFTPLVITACTGTPVAGSATSSVSILCAPGTVDLNLTGLSSATGLTFQWQSSPAGANTYTNVGPSLSSPAYTASVTASTDFRCVVTCTASAASANSTPVTVTLSGIPGNDNVCNAIILSLNGPSLCGNTTCATSVSDPAFSQSTPNNTVWFTYTPATTGPVSIRLRRPTPGVTNGVVNAWTGIYTATGACPSLVLTELAGNANAYNLPVSDSISSISTSLTAGTTYYIMIDGFNGSFGAYCIQLLTPPTPPACVANVSPVNNATNRPVNDTLKWRKAPGANITYDVYFGTTLPLAVALANYADTTVPVNGMTYNTTYYYYVVPKNAGSPATGCETNQTSFTTGAAPAAPANDECVNAIAISPYVSPINGTTISSTQSMAAEICASFTSPTAEDVWYSFTALQNGSATIALTNAGPALDAVIHGYSGTCGTLTNIGCADNSPSGGGNETLTLNGLVSGQTYYIRIYSWTSTTAQGNFTLTVTGTALPVRLTQFSGIRQGNVNKLTWTTVSEANNQGFELQRSADGKNFSMLVFVGTRAPEGNSNTPLTYNYADESPFVASAYYRLKQIDRDGKFTFSDVVFIKGNRIDKLDLVNVYPNPTVDRIQVVLVSPSSEKVQIIVSDLAGKVIISQSAQLVNGDNNISVDVSKLSAGSYVIKTICDKGCETATRKFVKY